MSSFLNTFPAIHVWRIAGGNRPSLDDCEFVYASECDLLYVCVLVTLLIVKDCELYILLVSM